MDLPKVLADLRAAGAAEAHVKLREDGSVEELRVTLGPAPRVVPLGLVDQDGKPVDLDEGMGVLEQDPMDEEIPPDAIQSSNYPSKKARGDAAS